MLLVSSIQQSEAFIHISILFSFSFPLGHHRELSRVPYAIHQILISYLFYYIDIVCIYIYMSISISQFISPHLPPLVKVKVTQSCLILCDSPQSSPGQNTGEGSLSPSQGDLTNSGTEPMSPTSQVVSLPAKPQGKPKNTGAGSLSLLQGIFPTQEFNWGFLHCRWILYHLSHQGSPSRPPW